MVWSLDSHTKSLYLIGASSSAFLSSNCGAGNMKDQLSLSWQNLAVDFPAFKYCAFSDNMLSAVEQGQFCSVADLPHLKQLHKEVFWVFLCSQLLCRSAARSSLSSSQKGLKLTKNIFKCHIPQGLRFLKTSSSLSVYRKAEQANIVFFPLAIYYLTQNEYFCNKLE